MLLTRTAGICRVGVAIFAATLRRGKGGFPPPCREPYLGASLGTKRTTHIPIQFRPVCWLRAGTVMRRQGNLPNAGEDRTKKRSTEGSADYAAEPNRGRR